ncbi:penicillin-binding protein transpeptidase [Halothece sp. PCC 7418]|uniref:peptidoglycan D,D-transpeptidase FtsI family protein n=1 Tax=Halothece sp. (strain PCC 7418) TaxID=65093 RepID=UPI0002A065D9|nr:penicillin-binding protein 2 [Halothece sp. PCC 7418]AFZ43218.1 penicillin-binding protein transpeptidase [Halothece sp. PCC 7418]
MAKLNWEFVRLGLIWVFFFLSAVGLGGRVYHLQIVQGEELHAKAKANQKGNFKDYVPRRSIVDREGNVLATDRVVYTLYVHPMLFQKSEAVIAEKLASILTNTSVSELSKQFQEKKTGIRLRDRLTEEEADQIRRLNSNGLDLRPKYARFYPHNTLAANVLGYVQKDDHQGKTGIEFTQQAKLIRPERNIPPVQKTGQGDVLPVSLPSQVVEFDEKQLQLTLNMRLQRLAHQALKKQMQAFRAKRGTVIVMDVETGELLSFVTEPTFDPNRYFKSDLADMKNWGVTDLYEPGSTFKPINVAIALEAGLIYPQEKIYDPGKMKVGGWTIRNHDYFSNGGHGKISIAEILQVSSNVGMIKIIERMQPLDYYKKLQELGLEEKVGIDLMGETAGSLKSKFQFTNYPIEPATASFGQGLSLTPIKLAQLHGAIANGGYLVKPHLVKGLVDQDGNLVSEKDQTRKQVFSSRTTKEVLAMMETVVSEGSGEVAQIPGYRLAGKTGTAQKAKGRSYGNEKITSFVSIFPVQQPRYVILAVVDEPKRPLAYGSTVAAPIVKEVIEGLITIEGIPPTHPEEFNDEEEDKD